jgi:hypothetical protein
MAFWEVLMFFMLLFMTFWEVLFMVFWEVFFMLLFVAFWEEFMLLFIAFGEVFFWEVFFMLILLVFNPTWAQGTAIMQPWKHAALSSAANPRAGKIGWTYKKQLRAEHYEAKSGLCWFPVGGCVVLY